MITAKDSFIIVLESLDKSFMDIMQSPLFAIKKRYKNINKLTNILAKT